MPLVSFQSICEQKQKIIISRDKGQTRKHIADNKSGHIVNHYRIDGVVIKEGLKCDYLLMDEDGSVAYLIELKGSDLVRAVQQLEQTERKLGTCLRDYSIKYRVVASRANTHSINHVEYIRFKRKHGAAFICREKEMVDSF